MHRLLVFLLVACTLGVSFTPGKDPVDFNGWEYMEWTWSKEKVEAALDKRGILYNAGSPNQKSGPTTSYYDYGMDIRLGYDAGHLYDIQQYRFYRISEKKQADKFYKKRKEKWIKKYGMPVADAYSEVEKCNVTKWELKYTEINMYYDDKYVEYTQFPGEAYRIYIHITQR